jgi:hypothetical protein
MSSENETKVWKIKKNPAYIPIFVHSLFMKLELTNENRYDIYKNLDESLKEILRSIKIHGGNMEISPALNGYVIVKSIEHKKPVDIQLGNGYIASGLYGELREYNVSTPLNYFLSATENYNDYVMVSYADYYKIHKYIDRIYTAENKDGQLFLTYSKYRYDVFAKK